MQLHNVINKMSDIAQKTKDDALSVQLCRISNRLAHQGYAFESELTDEETAFVSKFIAENFG